MDEAHVSRAVVLSTAYSLANPHKPPVPNERKAVRNDNDWTGAQVTRYPDRLTGFCSVNPLKAYAIEEINRCAKDPNHRMAILVHAHSNMNFNRPYGSREARIFLEQLLPEIPDITVVLAHMAGAGDFDESTQQASAVYAEAIARHDPRVRNLYFDACISADATKAALLAQRIREIGVSRIFYGSDAPVEGNLPVDALARWHKFPLTAEEYRSNETNLAPFLQPVPPR